MVAAMVVDSLEWWSPVETKIMRREILRSILESKVFLLLVGMPIDRTVWIRTVCSHFIILILTFFFAGRKKENGSFDSWIFDSSTCSILCRQREGQRTSDHRFYCSIVFDISFAIVQEFESGIIPALQFFLKCLLRTWPRFGIESYLLCLARKMSPKIFFVSHFTLL